MKNSVKKITLISACVLSAAMCLGSFAACGGPKAEHTDAKAATCTTAGNTEYWVKDGKYYSDEACKNEITEADTVVKALGHDFENGTYVTTDETQHWKVCARTGCDEISAKENHTIEWKKTDDKHSKGCTVCGKVTVAEANHSYNASGACECGNNSLFADVTAKGDGVTTEYATKSVSFSYSSNAALDYDDVSIEIPLKDMELYRYYEVTYVIESEAAGAHVDFYVPSDKAEYVGEYEDFDIVKGVNTITVKFVPKEVEEGVVTTRLTVYDVNVFNLKLTSVTCTADTGNYFDGWWLDTASEASASKPNGEVGQMTITATGNGDGWRLKLAKDVVLEKDHEYELTFVFNLSGRITENVEYTIYENKATISEKFCWCDHDGLYVKTFKFTANESCTIGSCLEYGQITNGNEITLTIYYVGLNDVTASS